MSWAVLVGLCGGWGIWFALLWKDEIVARRHFKSGRRWKFSWPWRAEAEAWKLFKDFPDFIELLALGLSSGLTLDRAWEEGVRFLPEGSLRAELRRVANDFSLGRPRGEALEGLMTRLRDDRLSGCLTLLAHSLKYGTPLEGTLLDQARRLRGAALLAVERRAQTASLRLLFPLVFFILPTLFIILFGPLALSFLETGRLF